jgi:TetR/AcrR family transcriptional regulator, transcriptional repressor for nem operon
MPRPQSFNPTVVLDAAMGLFWERGYEATSIDDLSQHLNISRPALYRQWESKEQLYQEALLHYRQLGHADFIAALQESPERAIEIITKRLTEIVNDAVDDPNNKGCFVVNATCERASLDPATRSQVAESLTSLEQHLSAALRGASTRGVRLRTDADAAARYLVVVIQGIRVVGKARPTRSALRGIVNVAISALVEAPTQTINKTATAKSKKAKTK